MRNLVLLHGALGAPAMLQPLATKLEAHYKVYCPAFPGHAGIASSEYRMAAMVDFLEQYLDDHALDRPLVFGYSMGGYAALALAAQSAGRLAGVATLATKLHWTAESSAQETKMLDPEKMEAKVPAFAAVLARRHEPLNWKAVVQGTAALMTDLGASPMLTAERFARIQDPVLLLLGDRDTMVSFEETREAYAAIPGARFGVLPATPHPIEKVSVELLSAGLHHFFEQCP
ncbi:MAG: alpha/beta hydrolase [Chitinophagaceae bacterium]|nr:MAG: alpha/beta hydrolase [Chitinophagaceae bacterium]